MKSYKYSIKMRGIKYKKYNKQNILKNMVDINPITSLSLWYDQSKHNN